MSVVHFHRSSPRILPAYRMFLPICLYKCPANNVSAKKGRLLRLSSPILRGYYGSFLAYNHRVNLCFRITFVEPILQSLPTCFSILMPLRSVNTYRVSFLITGSLASIGLSCWFFIEASTLDRPKVPLSLGYWLFAEVMFWMTRHFEIRYLEERENSKVGGSYLLLLIIRYIVCVPVMVYLCLTTHSSHCPFSFLPNCSLQYLLIRKIYIIIFSLVEYLRLYHSVQ